MQQQQTDHRKLKAQTRSPLSEKSSIAREAAAIEGGAGAKAIADGAIEGIGIDAEMAKFFCMSAGAAAGAVVKIENQAMRKQICRNSRGNQGI